MALKTKQVMTKKPVTIESGATIEQAAEVLRKNKISGAPVVASSSGKMVGIISEKDLFRAIYPNLKDIIQHIGLWLDRQRIKHAVDKKRNIKISKIMTTKVITAKPDTPVLKVGSQMLVNRIHRLPVVDKGKLVGIVTRHDIFNKLLQSSFKS
jgi:CBS domain-containing protein